MMSYMELATYLGLTNQLLGTFIDTIVKVDDETDPEILYKCQKALAQSQIIISKMGIDQLVDEMQKGSEK